MNLIAFRKKLIYIVAIVLLFVPLYLLGQPQTERDGELVNSGGKLAQLRQRYDIGQAQLGQIDPASESMKLATLGLRGVAATILWQRTDFYRREKYWDRLSATLNQIALLQPHYVSIWEHQSHNLTYNISVEFDDYQQRYEWIKKGINYLIRGTKFNKRQPVLQWDLGISTGQKIGIADEKRQYRELFRNDDEFHEYLRSQGLDAKQGDAIGIGSKPDHWLVGRLWFNKAYDLAESGATQRKSPDHFYSHGPKCLLRYSEAIEEEGVLDDRAKFAWNRAGNAWREFGNRDLVTTWNSTIKLNGLDAANRVITQEQMKFDSLTGEMLQKIIAERRAELTEQQRIAVDLPESERTTEQRVLAYEAGPKLKPTELEVADKMPRAQRIAAMEVASRLVDARILAQQIDTYRTNTNYEYWEIRAEAEQNDVTLAARRQAYEADQLFDRAEVEEGFAIYESAWKNWEKVFRFYPKMIDDDAADEIVKSVRRYQGVLDEKLGDNFPLTKFLQYKMQKQSASTIDPDILRQAVQWEQTARRYRSEGIRLTEADIVLPEKAGGSNSALSPRPSSPTLKDSTDANPAESSKTSLPARTNNPDEGQPPSPPGI